MEEHHSGSPKVRTFSCYSEVREIPGFKDENHLTKENYKELVGDYHFQEQARCCFERENGSLCRHLHNIGYVVRLKDESATIIGNVCADTNFNAEHEISRDRARYQNEKRRLENLARIQELVAGKDSILTSFREKREQLKALEVRIEEFLAAVGSRCAARLHGMTRDGRREVVITGIRIREYEENGEKVQERIRIPLTVGSISGLAVMRPNACQSIVARMKAVADAYRTAAQLAEPIRNSVLDELRLALSDAERVLVDTDDLLAAEKIFFAGDLSPLPFLVSDIGDRNRVARFVFGRVGKRRAKESLLSKEAELRSAHGVTKLAW
jgi:hypothetical protein